MPRFVTAVLATLLFLPVVNAQSDKDSDKTTLETAEEVLEANIAATGGRAAWATVQTIQVEGLRLSDGPMGGGKMTSTYVETFQYPGYSHRASQTDTNMGRMNVAQVTTPDAAWVEAGPMGRREMPLDPSLDLEGPCVECTILDSSEHVITGMTTDSFDGADVYVVSFEAYGESLRRFYDQQSLLLVAEESAAIDGGDPLLATYSDYRNVDGLTMPFEREETIVMRMIQRDGSGEESETFHRAASTVTIENIEINPDVDESLFASE